MQQSARLNSFFLFFLALFLFSCSLTSKTLKDHEAVQEDFWSDFSKRNLEDRIISNDRDEIIDFVEDWKKENIIDYKVNLGTDPLKVKTIHSALKLLPKVIYDFIDKNVRAVVLVSNLNVPIASVKINNAKDGQHLLLLDENINSLGLNEWYLYREFSAFRVEENDIVIETYLSHSNNSIDTIHFLFSQAIALILSEKPEIIPSSITSVALSDYPYLSRSWLNDKGIIDSKYEKELEEIKFLSFYGRSTKSYPDTKIYEYYKLLEQTNFTNLYASTGPIRDFVETLAMYIHVYYFQRPFHIDFYKNHELMDSFTHCLNRPRCGDKQKDLKSLLEKYL